LNVSDIVSVIAAVVTVLGLGAIAGESLQAVLRHRLATGSPRRRLDTRLAEGEISEEGYLEALRLLSAADDDAQSLM
jgi:uncharacterized membrane protein